MVNAKAKSFHDSFIGWIYFSGEDQKRAQDYLRVLSEGTLDELGFGIIRDAFADLFFPATSTIMEKTRGLSPGTLLKCGRCPFFVEPRVRQ
jgi:hypothetical protein